MLVSAQVADSRAVWRCVLRRHAARLVAATAPRSRLAHWLYRAARWGSLRACAWRASAVISAANCSASARIRWSPPTDHNAMSATSPSDGSQLSGPLPTLRFERLASAQGAPVCVCMGLGRLALLLADRQRVRHGGGVREPARERRVRLAHRWI